MRRINRRTREGLRDVSYMLVGAALIGSVILAVMFTAAAGADAIICTR
jgi:hypothetical protein